MFSGTLGSCILVVVAIVMMLVLWLSPAAQVDNPCSLLDQENSKKFLQGSESDKYAFFMRATDLQRVVSVSKK